MLVVPRCHHFWALPVQPHLHREMPDWNSIDACPSFTIYPLIIFCPKVLNSYLPISPHKHLPPKLRVKTLCPAEILNPIVISLLSALAMVQLVQVASPNLNSLLTTTLQISSSNTEGPLPPPTHSILQTTPSSYPLLPPLAVHPAIPPFLSSGQSIKPLNSNGTLISPLHIYLPDRLPQCFLPLHFLPPQPFPPINNIESISLELLISIRLRLLSAINYCALCWFHFVADDLSSYAV